ncbi:hypothetical protein L1887_62101 [Cichorium endivia]|nr:hypothetical protein L1887_62101 [Cichorium endivia]
MSSVDSPRSAASCLTSSSVAATPVSGDRTDLRFEMSERSFGSGVAFGLGSYTSGAAYSSGGRAANSRKRLGGRRDDGSAETCVVPVSLGRAREGCVCVVPRSRVQCRCCSGAQLRERIERAPSTEGRFEVRCCFDRQSAGKKSRGDAPKVMWGSVWKRGEPLRKRRVGPSRLCHSRLPRPNLNFRQVCASNEGLTKSKFQISTRPGLRKGKWSAVIDWAWLAKLRNAQTTLPEPRCAPHQQQRHIRNTLPPPSSHIDHPRSLHRTFAPHARLTGSYRTSTSTRRTERYFLPRRSASAHGSIDSARTFRRRFLVDVHFAAQLSTLKTERTSRTK